MKKRILVLILLTFISLIMTSCDIQVNGQSYDFAINYLSEQVDVTVNGESPCEKYSDGTILTITINPKTGYEIDSFIINNEEKSIINNEYLYKITNDTTIFINMKTSEGYSLEIKGTPKFTYEVTKPNQNEKYVAGTMIELKITDPTNYKLEKVLINNTKATVVDNTTSFTINENTIVEVFFESIIINIDEDTLKSIQGDVKISGIYELEYPDYDEISHTKLTTIFENDKVHQEEYSVEDDELTYNVTFYNKNGYAATTEVNIKNEVVEEVSDNLFAEYDNPFKDLTVSDFEYDDDGYYHLKTNLDETASAITGWDETISEFKLKVEDGKVVKIIITTSIMTDYYDDYYVVSYDLNVSDHGTAKVTEIKPYEHLDAHDTLKTALDKIGYNYTVNHLDQEPGYEDIEYKSYILENIVYCGYESDGTTSGYLEKDGNVYDFTYDGTTVTIHDPLDLDSFKDIQSDFKGFVAEIFDYVGDGRYVIKNSDYAAEVAYLIGYDYDVKMLGDYATSFEIILKNDTLYQIKYDYLVWGVEGTVTLTYSDFNTTICPIKLDNMEQVTVFDQYAGTYVTEDKKHTVVIAQNSIKIDNVEMEIEGFDSSQNMFYGTLNNVDAYVMQYFGKSELWIEYGDTGYVASNESLYLGTTAPTEYYGTFESDEHKIVVSEDGITFDGTKLELLCYEYLTGVVCKFNGVKYYLYVDLDENDNVVCYFLRPDISIAYILDYVSENE